MASEGDVDTDHLRPRDLVGLNMLMLAWACTLYAYDYISVGRSQGTIVASMWTPLELDHIGSAKDRFAT